MFRARPGVTWLDIAMAKHYRHSIRRHLIKLHPRNDQITVVRSAMQVSFLYAAHVTPAITREIVYTRHVDDQMSSTCKVDVLNLQVALLPSAAGGDVAAARGETGALDDLF